MWADDPSMTAAVKASKRSLAYRAHRGALARIRPADVWLDPEVDAHVVLYELAHEGTTNRFLAFTVDRIGRTVRDAAVLRMEATPDGWRVDNAPAAA